MPVDKIADPVAAASAYANTSQGANKSGVAGKDEANFGDLLKKAAVDSIDTMYAGERASAAAVTGKADLTDVVEAVTASELTLQTVVALRDRMISAYQDIMRMPI